MSDTTRSTIRPPGTQRLATLTARWGSLSDAARARGDPDSAAFWQEQAAIGAHLLGALGDVLIEIADCATRPVHLCTSSRDSTPLAQRHSPPARPPIHSGLFADGGMVDGNGDLDTWVQNLRGRLERSELAGLSLPILSDSDDDVSIEGYVRFLLDNLGSVEHLSSKEPMYRQFLGYRRELLDELRRLRELLG
jgi:hypothetical protein